MILDLLEKLVKVLAGLALATVFVLVIAQVVCRYILDYPLPSASELSIYAMIWSIFLGAAVAFRHGSHIAVEMLRNSLPYRARRVADTLVFVALLIFLLIVVYYGYALSGHAMRQISPASRIPVGYIALAMPLCSVLAIVFLTENFIRGWLRREQEHDAIIV